MRQVFRVEHKVTGRGPFQTDEIFCQSLAAMTKDYPELKNPGADGLGLGDTPFSFVFGCLSLETLAKWFLLGASQLHNDVIIEKLRERGFHVVEYLVEEEDCWVSHSGIQVAFSTSTSKEEGLIAVHDVGILLCAHEEIELLAA